ncbi:MAG: HAMP domain-containing histidine kinase [candidate division Zixibacteria bacterium]|nr:HAMP domain-containing histidine kinase [candidate division Zixibacteria bacterium]
MNLSSRRAFILFLVMVVFLLAQAAWWVVLMARLVAENVRVATELNGSPEYIEQIHQQATQRQIMVGMEGAFFIIVFAFGVWLMYRALVRAEELKFHQQNFMLAVTHELRTPLASMRIYLDTLQSPKISPEKKQEIIPRLREDTSRLDKMVQDVLEAGRFERHGHHLNPDRFNLSALVRERAEALDRAPSKVPKAVIADIEDNIEIIGDAPALGRALDAILENTLRYHDGGRVEVAVKLRNAGGKAVIEISDKGIGLDRKELARVFDRFYRVGDEMTRHTSGTGLGLYLCREIIRAHGGKVAAESDGPGKGSRFIVTLKVVS